MAPLKIPSNLTFMQKQFLEYAKWRVWNNERRIEKYFRGEKYTLIFFIHCPTIPKHEPRVAHFESTNMLLGFETISEKKNLGTEDREFTGIFENEKRHYQFWIKSHEYNNHKRCYETFFQLHNNRSATFIAVLNLHLEQSAKIKQWAQFHAVVQGVQSNILRIYTVCLAYAS